MRSYMYIYIYTHGNIDFDSVFFENPDEYDLYSQIPLI